jgi:hypothetical protein
MAFKLIKEAQARASLDPTQLKILETFKKELGVDSITGLMENTYRPTQEDYKKWLDVVLGYAKDSGLNINKKGDFLDIAGAVLENDPLEPPYSMHEAIMNKLWLDFRASKHSAKIEKVARAQEEEERIAQSVQSFAEPQEDDEYDEYADSEIRDMGSSADDASQDEVAWWHEDMPDQEGDDQFDAEGNMDPNGEFDVGGKFDAERGAGKRDMARDMEQELAFSDEESGGEGTEASGVAAKPKKKMNMLQTMLSMPKTSINQSLKGVETEGSAAWRQHQLPKNPHPDGSMAYKAWDRGMKKAMKDFMGINDKPVQPVKKKKKPAGK